MHQSVIIRKRQKGRSYNSIGTAKIRQVVDEHIKATGNKPLVIVDYLQILAPNVTAASAKQTIDTAVVELKQIATQHKIPVLAISSFNRDNYSSPVSMTSFKESGAIEYSSDLLFGLQFKGMDELSQTKDPMRAVEEWRKADTRELQLKILKNRNGASGDSVYFSYYPKYNLFQEMGKR